LFIDQLLSPTNCHRLTTLENNICLKNSVAKVQCDDDDDDDDEDEILGIKIILCEDSGELI